MTIILNETDLSYDAKKNIKDKTAYEVARGIDITHFNRVDDSIRRADLVIFEFRGYNKVLKSRL